MKADRQEDTTISQPYMRSSESLKNLEDAIQKQQQTTKEPERSTYTSENRTSINTIISVQFIQEFSQQSNRWSTTTTAQVEDAPYNSGERVSEHLKTLQINQAKFNSLTKANDKHAVVKQRFQTLINEHDMRIYNHSTSDQREKRLAEFTLFLIAYFHICNFIFDNIYSNKEIELIVTIFQGYLQKVEQILNRKGNQKLIFFKTKVTEYNLLYLAAQSGRENVCRYFLSRKECLNFSNANSNPINVAAWCGHLDIVKLLVLDYGMSPNVTNCYGNTAQSQTQNGDINQFLSSDINKARIGRLMTSEMTKKEKELIDIITLSEGPSIFQRMKKIITENPELLKFRSKDNNYSLLSIAVMSINVNAVFFLLKTGCYCDVDPYNTNPLRLAVQAANLQLVEILLAYGIPHDIQDRYGIKPIDALNISKKLKKLENFRSRRFTSVSDQAKYQNEKSKESKPMTKAQNLQEIYNLLKNAEKFKSNQLTSQLIKENLLVGVINIFSTFNGKAIFVGRKLITKNYFLHFDSEKFKDCFHGTLFQNLVSIIKEGPLQNGMSLKNGTVVKARQGHIQEGEQYRGRKDWNKGFFTSQSIFYAASYSISGSERSSEDVCIDCVSWIPLIQLKVKKGTYEEEAHTRENQYKMMEGEPKMLECVTRLEPGEESFGDKISAVAIVLLNQDYYKDFYSLKKKNFTYKEITDLFLDSSDEKIFKSYREAQNSYFS